MPRLLDTLRSHSESFGQPLESLLSSASHLFYGKKERPGLSPNSHDVQNASRKPGKKSSFLLTAEVFEKARWRTRILKLGQKITFGKGFCRHPFRKPSNYLSLLVCHFSFLLLEHLSSSFFFCTSRNMRFLRPLLFAPLSFQNYVQNTCEI